MKIFTVHLKPDEGIQEKPVFIREGFNLAAFVLTGFWMLYYRLWIPLLIILAFNGVLMIFTKGGYLSSYSIAAIQFGFNAFVGFEANDWRRAHLLKKGYIFADVSASESLLRAEQRYFERYLAA